MQWHDGFIAVDWGTTNRRAYLLDGSNRERRSFEDGKGILSVGQGNFPAAVREIRAALGDFPLLMAGMVGSNRGWLEAPYVPCPAGLRDLASNICWAEPRRTAIVPGVSLVLEDRADVMRGEEVQLLGAVAAGLVPPDCTVCHPGTHSKWAQVENGRIAEFRTAMTGELFSLLREHSILSSLLGGDVAPGPAFRSGVHAGLAGTGLAAELFAIRAGVLLGRAQAADAASRASGLLIGADIASSAGKRTGVIYSMGRPDLTRLYAAALEIAGHECREVDGDDAFIAGIKKIAELIE